MLTNRLKKEIHVLGNLSLTDIQKLDTVGAILTVLYQIPQKSVQCYINMKDIKGVDFSDKLYSKGLAIFDKIEMNKKFEIKKAVTAKVRYCLSHISEQHMKLLVPINEIQLKRMQMLYNSVSTLRTAFKYDKDMGIWQYYQR